VPALLVTDGPLAGRRFEVDARLLVGRVDADLTIDDELVSRRHAEIRAVEGALEIEDRGSLNGTWVNGERIAGPRTLVPGDVIKLGKTSLAVESDPADTGRTVLASVGEALRPPAPQPVVPEPLLPPTPEPVAPEPPPIPADAPPIAAEAQPSAPEPQPIAPEPEATPPPTPPPAPAPPPVSTPPEAPAPVARQPVSAEDELRPVTALFADIVGSTGLGERLASHEVKVVVGECVSRMTRAVERFGGTVQAYMGDGIAAFFGLPLAHEDDPERAARAALAIVEVVTDYAREVEAAWGISNFNLRVGINTGETAVGLVGHADPQSVALGDTTNVAARLQSSAEPGTIAVGEATAQCLVHAFVLEPLGELSVKGRDKPVEAWRLFGVQTATQAAPLTPLVGRDDEVKRLTAVVEELTHGRGQMLFLLGEAGIGKTRLLAELRQLATGKVTWLEGRCHSYGTELPYGPLIQMLRGWVGSEEGEPELSVRTKLRAKLGLLPDSELSNMLPYLSRLLSLKLEPDDEERMRGLTPEELAAEIRRAYRAWIESLSRQGPVVAAIEDVHWADASTRELAEDLLEVADLAPVLLVATFRLDTASEGWRLRMRVLTDYAHRAVELSLNPLGDAAARQLLATHAKSGTLKMAELEQIVKGAEGNPLYLEELLNAFVDNTDFLRGLTWAPTVTQARILTPALESLLLARIDRLPPEARKLAQTAALVGRIFRLRVLEHVSESLDVERDLSVLLRADIIRELRRYPDPEYTFKHGLLRRACLATLPPGRRRELYATVGTAFETLFPDTLDDHLEVLAHYFSRSHDLPKALEYLERAGAKASELDAVAQAGELLGRALSVAEKLEDNEALARVRQHLDELEARTGERLPHLRVSAEQEDPAPEG
jgi:class 3 adenylate cyclase